MITLNSDHRVVLKILEGCPCGATDYNLSSRFNVSMQTMIDLVKAKLISVREHRLAHDPSSSQCWVCITPAGLAALDASKKDLHEKVRDIITPTTPTVHELMKGKSHD
jgi:hypothetical protein